MTLERGGHITHGMRTIAPSATADCFLNASVAKRLSSDLSSWTCLGKRDETCLHDPDSWNAESSCMSRSGGLKKF